jgi:hypothetical protein
MGGGRVGRRGKGTGKGVLEVRKELGGICFGETGELARKD